MQRRLSILLVAAIAAVPVAAGVHHATEGAGHSSQSSCAVCHLSRLEAERVDVPELVAIFAPAAALPEASAPAPYARETFPAYYLRAPPGSLES